MPFLADLQKQSQYYQRYLIDKHLQKWASALENLSKETQSEYFEELLEFTKERKLYAHAIEIYEKSKETEKLNRILDAYGEYLVSQKHYGQAALSTFFTRTISRKFRLNGFLLSVATC